MHVLGAIRGFPAYCRDFLHNVQFALLLFEGTLPFVRPLPTHVPSVTFSFIFILVYYVLNKKGSLSRLIFALVFWYLHPLVVVEPRKGCTTLECITGGGII